MPPPEPVHRYRPTALDQALASERTVVVAGPIAGLEENRVRANLQAILDVSPEARITLAPEVGARTWPYRPHIAAAAMLHRSHTSPDDLGSLLTEIHVRGPDRGPLDVLLCGDHLVADYSHGIGDGRLGPMLLAALSGDVDTERSNTLARGLPRGATWTALWRHYREHPGTARDFMRLRKCNKEFGDQRPVGVREIHNRTLDTQSRTAYMDPATVSELRRWATTHADGASAASVTVASWIAALRESGVNVDERVTVLVDCRRYLGPEQPLAQGNFAVAIPIKMPRPATPSAIAEIVRDVVRSGWPVAILGMAEVKSVLRRGSSNASPEPETVAVPDRLRIAVSDLGRLSIFDHTEWGQGGPPQLAAYLEPDGPDAASLLVSELAGGRTFTVTFCGAMVDPAAIGSALDRMCHDPIGTLLSAQ